MRHLILSRDHGQIGFHMPDDGGHIALEAHLQPGVRTATLCEGGYFQGQKLIGTQDNFQTLCKRWHAQRLKICKTYGYTYRPAPTAERAQQVQI